MRKGSSTPWLPMTAGLLFLQLILIVAVYNGPHVPAFTPAAIETKLDDFQTGYYFIEAEILAKRLLADPEARWDHYGLDGISFCGVAGHGVWCAGGVVMVLGEKAGKTEPWKVYFRPDHPEAALFIKVGDKLISGDLETAQRLSGEWPLKQPASHAQ